MHSVDLQTSDRLYQLMVHHLTLYQRSTGAYPPGKLGGGGGQGRHGCPTSISEPNKVQQFHFRTSGILLFTGVQKLYEPEISGFLPHYANIFGQFMAAFHFFLARGGNRSLQVGPSVKVRYLTLNLLKIFLLWTIRKKTTMNKNESWTG